MKITHMADAMEISDNQAPFSNAIVKTSIVAAHSIRQMLCKGGISDPLECENHLHTIYDSVLKLLGKEIQPGEIKTWISHKRMKMVDEIIESRIDEKLTVAHIALELGVSDAHFSRQFSKTIGKSPYSYITDKRIARARKLIFQTNQDLSSIALAVGFCSHSHMTDVFNKRLGITPTFLRSIK